MTVDTGKGAPAVGISYTVTFPEAQAHYLTVEMHICQLSQDSLTLKLPVWTPGSYLVREFAKNIETLSVTTDKETVPFKKTRKNWWEINTAGLNAINVKYTIYCNEISVRTSLVDASHAFISTSGVFLYPDGMLDQPSTIHIISYKGWSKVSTSLEMVDNDPFTRYSPNYDILFDSPIEVGNQEIFEFMASGVKHEVAMVGGGNYDAERLKTDIAKIVDAETAIFGENPNENYVFIVHNYQKGGGGLEHLSSTVLGATRDAYSDEQGYQSFLTLVSHEYFHLWNVKRLRPAALGPFDYDNENYTTDLWIAEGFTAYYEDLILRHAGIITIDNYLKVMAADINIVENIPGRKVLTVADASYNAWIKAYRPDENAQNSMISYYSKGSVLAMMLNLEIMNESDAKYSLDDVMRHMYDVYYKAKDRGFTDLEFKAGLQKFAGKKLDDFYQKYVYGLDELDYNKYLAYAGYSIIDENADTNNPSLGINFTATNGKIIITSVLRDGAAWIAGINFKDELTAIDGEEIDAAAILKDRKPGDKIMVSLNRDGLPMTLTVTLLRNATLKYNITSLTNPSEQQIKVRNKWLKP